MSFHHWKSYSDTERVPQLPGYSLKPFTFSLTLTSPFVPPPESSDWTAPLTSHPASGGSRRSSSVH